MAAGFSYDTITKYIVTAVCAEPLHIGSAMGDKEAVLIHPVDDIPFIQATSIAGVFREYFTRQFGEEAAGRMFGAGKLKSGDNAADYASRVRFGDGIFQENDQKIKLELRPHVSINRETGTCNVVGRNGSGSHAGQKFNMEYIGAGARFIFPVYLYGNSGQEQLETVFAAVHQEVVQFGGKKSEGCGFIHIESLAAKTFEMKKAEDRKLWAKEDELSNSEYRDILNQLKQVEVSGNAYDITVFGKTEGALLVKSIALSEFGKDVPDSVNIQNSNKDYIVPGSSFKGAIRAQMEKIAAYLGKTEIIRETFGYTGKGEESGKAGNVSFYDTIVGEREDNDLAALSHRIHIDKLTGGVIHGALFAEKNVAGNVQFRVVVRDKNKPDQTCGLLILALRDLAIGAVSVGGGNSVGKGIIHVDRIVISDRKNKSEVTLNIKENAITGDQKIITKCIAAVQGKES